MRCNHTPGQSAEMLRMILPRIARHGGHYAPTSYSVWYEHVAGINPTAARSSSSCCPIPRAPVRWPSPTR